MQGAASGPKGTGDAALEIQGAASTETASLEDMSVDHGGPEVGAAEGFLDGANIVARFEEVDG
jgi:hypothetical protein